MDGRLRLLTLKTLVCSEELGAAGDGGNRRRGQVEVAAVFRLFPATRSFPARTTRGGGRGRRGAASGGFRFVRSGSRRRHRRREEGLGFRCPEEMECGRERQSEKGIRELRRSSARGAPFSLRRQRGRRGRAGREGPRQWRRSLQRRRRRPGEGFAQNPLGILFLFYSGPFPF